MGFAKHPGLIFVVATLLPLASFVFLLIINAIRSAVRRAPEGSVGAGVYQAFGGDEPRQWPAFVATAAIALAFLCSLIGFIQYASDSAVLHQKHDEAGAHHHEMEEEFNERWSGRFTWIGIGPFAGDDDPSSALQLGYKIDYLSGVMFLMVTLIATLIHVFSMGYVGDELTKDYEDHQVHTEHGHLHRRGRYGRFFLYLSLFCFSMLNLVLADNLFQVFLSWELVGICSYLLIGFYYERKSASNAANKAFIVNRVGDAGFIVGLLVIWTFVGTFNFDSMFQRLRAPVTDGHDKPVANGGKFVRGQEAATTGEEAEFEISDKGAEVFLFPAKAHVDAVKEGETPHKGHVHGTGPQVEISEDHVHVKHRNESERRTIPYWMLIVAGLGIFLGCVGKSAQFPLHVWLPDAMEGPTPVSALIHAATMVAAGVYLVGRTYPLFTPEARLVIAYTGAITLFVAATIAVVVTDIKRVLAYSTVSQLGYMMLALGVGGWVAGLFHLITHAFFKALLFLGSGSVIHGCHHEQDMTRMGGLYPKMKITALTMLMAVLAISGIPGFSGWYSKDSIVAASLGFVIIHPEHLLLFVLPLVTAGITTFYMFRLWCMTFTGKPRDQHVYDHAHESPPLMTVPLIVLAVFSVIVAWGWPFFSSHFPFVNSEASVLEKHVHHAQPHSVQADFGTLGAPGHEEWSGPIQNPEETERYWAHEHHHFAGNLALLIVVLGLLFAYLFYYRGVLSPNEARRQFPKLHRFLVAKWYFDELYHAVIVRPSMAIANWCKVTDLKGIDSVLHASASVTVWLSWKNVGRFDRGVVDGLANMIARVAYATGGFFRNFQTGYLRSYVLFLVLAAVGIFAVLSYFVALAAAGG